MLFLKNLRRLWGRLLDNWCIYMDLWLCQPFRNGSDYFRSEGQLLFFLPSCWRATLVQVSRLLPTEPTFDYYLCCRPLLMCTLQIQFWFSMILATFHHGFPLDCFLLWFNINGVFEGVSKFKISKFNFQLLNFLSLPWWYCCDCVGIFWNCGTWTVN